MENKYIWDDSISIWKLCEYNLSIRVVKELYDHNLSINKLKSMTEDDLSNLYGISKHSLYHKCINAIHRMNITDTTYKSISVFALFSRGISETFVNRLFNCQLSLTDIAFKYPDELAKIINSGISKSKKIIDTSKILLNDFGANLSYDSIIKYDDEEIYNAIKNGPDGVNIVYLSNILDIPLNTIQEIIDRLISLKRIEYTNLGLKCIPPSLEIAVKNIVSDKKRKMVQMRLEGHTLEFISNEFCLTRERVRQIISQCYKIFPKINEDDYKYLFEKYLFEKDTFKKYINNDDHIYNYLSSRYKKGKITPTPRNMLLEGIINQTQYDNLVTKDFIKTEYGVIKKKRIPLLKYISKKIKGYITSTEFVTKYNQFIDERANGNDDLKINKRYMEGRYAEFDLINSYKNGFRHYEISRDIYNAIIELINFYSFDNTIISSKKFIDTYPELITEYNIYDEYELHNILKIGYLKFEGNRDIIFLRMPGIQFGNTDKHDFILNHIFQMAPITIENFANYMNKKYGFKKSSFIAYLGSEFSEYIDGKNLIIYASFPNDDEIEKVKKLLNSDFYFIEDYQKIILNNHLTKNYLSKNYINILGYNSFSGYLLSKKWISAKDYFINLITKNDVFDLKKIDNRLKNITSFTSYLYEYEKNLDIFLIRKDLFINIRRLYEKLQISKKYLEQKIEKILSLIDDNEYFTIDSLISKGFKEFVRQYGFEDTFYVSLLKKVSNIQSIKFDNYCLFRKSSKIFTKTTFIESIIYSNGAMTIYDIENYLHDVYGIKANFEKLEYMLKNCNLYYDSTLEKAYIDYEEFLEDL